MNEKIPPWLKSYPARMVEGFVSVSSLLIAITGFFNGSNNIRIYGIIVPVTIIGLLMGVFASFAWYFTEKSVDDDLKAKLKVNLCDEDKKLMDELRTIIDNDIIYYLRDHDFGGEFLRRKLHNLHTLNNYWNNARYEFANKELNNYLIILKAKSASFMSFIGLNTFPTDDEGFSRIERPTVIDNKFRLMQDTINKLATETFASYQDLEKCYKSLL